MVTFQVDRDSRKLTHQIRKYRTSHHLRIEGVAEGVAEDVEGEDGDGDGDAGEDGHPPGGAVEDVAVAGLDHRAPGGGGGPKKRLRKLYPLEWRSAASTSLLL